MKLKSSYETVGAQYASSIYDAPRGLLYDLVAHKKVLRSVLRQIAWTRTQDIKKLLAAFNFHPIIIALLRSGILCL